MSDTSPALVAQQQHRNMAAGIGPTSKSRIEKKKKKKATHFGFDFSQSTNPPTLQLIEENHYYSVNLK